MSDMYLLELTVCAVVDRHDVSSGAAIQVIRSFTGKHELCHIRSGAPASGW
jgi:hypothetical protein